MNAECKMQNAEQSLHSAFCILHFALHLVYPPMRRVFMQRQLALRPRNRPQVVQPIARRR
jgi:hypothetical protein